MGKVLDALVISGDSYIGGLLVDRLRNEGYEVAATSRRSPPTGGTMPFDLRWPSYLPHAKVTYFCTGINGFLPCELNADEAWRINVTCTLEAAQKRPGKVVFLSSAAVESHPQTVYGKCKAAAEAGFLKFDGAAFRFGPVAFPGRNVYPNGEYQPITPIVLTGILTDCIPRWVPGIHRVLDAGRILRQAA